MEQNASVNYKIDIWLRILLWASVKNGAAISEVGFITLLEK